MTWPLPPKECGDNQIAGTSLAVQWSQLCTSTARGVGLIPIQRTKISRAVRQSQNNNNDENIKPKLLTVLTSDFSIWFLTWGPERGMSTVYLSVEMLPCSRYALEERELLK